MRFDIPLVRDATGARRLASPIPEAIGVRKSITIITAGAAICVAALAIWRLNAAEPRPQPQLSSPIPVVATKVQVSDVPIVMTGIGTVEAYNVVDIHTQVTGTIDKIGFVEGQTVHPGSLIAQLDPRPFEAVLKQAEANLARDEAHLANAQDNLTRYVRLLKENFASAQQVADQTSAVSQMNAAIAADKAAVFSAQTQLSYTTISSPIDGVTGIRRVDIGNIVQPSTATPIVTITQTQPISVVFTLPQKDVPAVQVAMTKGTLTTVAYGQDDRSKLGEGTLLLVNNMISQSSGTVQLKATFPNRNQELWPGEFVNVQLTVAVRHNGITVPLDALQQGQNGEFVFLVQPDGKVQERQVALGETLNGRALITSGLQPGDTVVIAGQYRLSDDVKVAEVPPSDPHVQNITEASAGML
jgi:multidrug efflux system membrane fusion protein